MIASIKRANELTDIINSVGHRWSKAIADQKADRMAALRKAQRRQDAIYLNGDYSAKIGAEKVSKEITSASKDLKNAYSNLVAKYKEFKKGKA